jgi:hypothetical protein
MGTDGSPGKTVKICPSEIPAGVRGWEDTHTHTKEEPEKWSKESSKWKKTRA